MSVGFFSLIYNVLVAMKCFQTLRGTSCWSDLGVEPASTVGLQSYRHWLCGMAMGWGGGGGGTLCAQCSSCTCVCVYSNEGGEIDSNWYAKWCTGDFYLPEQSPYSNPLEPGGCSEEVR